MKAVVEACSENHPCPPRPQVYLKKMVELTQYPSSSQSPYLGLRVSSTTHMLDNDGVPYRCP